GTDANLTDNVSEGVAFYRDIEKCLKAVVFCIVEVRRHRPLEFLPYLNPFLGIMHNTFFSLTSTEREKPWTVLSVVFLSNVIDCKEYRKETAAFVTTTNHSSSKLITAGGDVNIESK